MVVVFRYMNQLLRKNKGCLCIADFVWCGTELARVCLNVIMLYEKLQMYIKWHYHFGWFYLWKTSTVTRHLKTYQKNINGNGFYIKTALFDNGLMKIHRKYQQHNSSQWFYREIGALMLRFQFYHIIKRSGESAAQITLLKHVIHCLSSQVFKTSVMLILMKMISWLASVK